MQILWHGSQGPEGKSKGILTIPVEPEVGARIGRNLKILPGINDDISPDDWKVAVEIPLVKHLVAEGFLEVVDYTNLNDKNTIQAKKVITQTIDRALLNKWREKETRLDVVKAIDDHLALLSKKPEPKKKE